MGVRNYSNICSVGFSRCSELDQLRKSLINNCSTKKMSLKKKAFEARATRKDSQWFLDNFLVNVSKAALLMRACTHFRADEILFQEAIRNYVIALVGALETFYRDLFVHLYRDKPTVVTSIVSKIRKKQKFDLTHSELNEAEIASMIVNFQRLSDVNSALSPLIRKGSDYFEEISDFTSPFAVPTKGAGLYDVKLLNGWKENLKALLEDRHRFVHDRNSDCDTSPEFMQRIETDVLMLAQISAAYFLGRDDQSTWPPNTTPMFFVINDLIATDWVDGDLNEVEQGSNGKPDPASS